MFIQGLTMSILVFLQANENKVSKVSLCAVTVANKLKDKWSKSDIYGVVLGENSKAVAEDALSYGFTKVFYSENEVYSKYIAKNYSQTLSSLATDNSCDTIIGSATSTYKDFLPLIAVSLEAGQASDIIAVNDDGSLKRPMYAGNAIADVEIATSNKLVSVRASSFSPSESSSATGEAVEITSVATAYNKAEVVSYEIAKKDRPDLNEAEVVVSGGRGLGSKEKFEEVMFPLADKLNAAIGASRAVVDAGFVPNDWQVGQTGKVVAPNLYIAVGISGAIQHLAGMKDSKTIVAINKDPEAPIFEIADYGLVADLFEAVPQFIEKA